MKILVVFVSLLLLSLFARSLTVEMELGWNETTTTMQDNVDVNVEDMNIIKLGCFLKAKRRCFTRTIECEIPRESFDYNFETIQKHLKTLLRIRLGFYFFFGFDCSCQL